MGSFEKGEVGKKDKYAIIVNHLMNTVMFVRSSC